jgi:ribonuclease HII
MHGSFSSDIFIAGVDEAGRGPLAGPVIAAAVILNPAHPIAGLADSKKLTEKRRDFLFAQIRQHALAWSVARATVAEIDEINILQASLLAMQRAVSRLKIAPSKVIVDGNHCPLFACEAEAIIKGDQTEPAISAASIVAKVLRDRLMQMLHRRYPQYGFAGHKGYPTGAHIAALQEHGISRVHRLTFGPVAAIKKAP